MIYFLITTSLSICDSVRKEQYEQGIYTLKRVIQELDINNYKIIIIENNGRRQTYLDTFQSEVFYTNNNYLPTNNRGYKELQDIFDCIAHYGIKDDDFIVKMTGRYILQSDSPFMNSLKNLDKTGYQCIITYGPYSKPVNYKMTDCITGLIGMQCIYVKQIVKPRENECVEWKWGEATYLINDSRICILDKLGIDICPGSNTYFSV